MQGYKFGFLYGANITSNNEPSRGVLNQSANIYWNVSTSNAYETMLTGTRIHTLSSLARQGARRRSSLLVLLVAPPTCHCGLLANAAAQVSEQNQYVLRS